MPKNPAKAGFHTIFAAAFTEGNSERRSPLKTPCCMRSSFSEPAIEQHETGTAPCILAFLGSKLNNQPPSVAGWRVMGPLLRSNVPHFVSSHVLLLVHITRIIVVTQHVPLLCAHRCHPHSASGKGGHLLENVVFLCLQPPASINTSNSSLPFTWTRSEWHPQSPGGWLPCSYGTDSFDC